MGSPPPSSGARWSDQPRPARAGLLGLLGLWACVALANVACSKAEQEAAAGEPSIARWLNEPRAHADVIVTTSGSPRARAAPDAGAADPTSAAPDRSPPDAGPIETLTENKPRHARSSARR
jgi:hypothetical protein